MDVDVYSFTHHASWVRLDQLSRRRRLTGPEVDELIALYRGTSRMQARLSAGADYQLEPALSAILLRARNRVLGARTNRWAEVGRFFTHRFPAAAYRAWPWWVGVTMVFLVLSIGLSYWVAEFDSARELLGLPRDHSGLTARGGRFETYYSEHPNGAFAAQVWTNNAWVAAIALFTGVLVLPAVYLLFMNALNLGVSAGLMADAGRLDSFFGFILPHGMLELTAIFVAGGVGLRLGWTLIDPGESSRAAALARQGRATATIALGLVGVLFVSGLLEGFVTPSALPAAVRITIGLCAELMFLAYVFVLGRRAVDERAEDLLGTDRTGTDRYFDSQR